MLDRWEQHRLASANKVPTIEEFQTFLDTKSKGRREYEGDDFSGFNRRNNLYRPLAR